MGAKDSKPSCISYDDAVKRVTDAEFRRIKEAFKRSAGVNGTILSKTAFNQDVLCESVPSVVADWLYTACGGTSKGIPFKELLCGLVLLTRGTQEEKIKFLWNLYCNDSGTQVIKNDFIKALQLEQNYQLNTDKIRTPIKIIGKSTPQQQPIQQSVTTIIVSLFGQAERVSFEQFKSWIIIYPNSTVLSRWLLIETCVNLSSELETPTFYQSLAGVTHLEEQDIGDLEKVFWLLKGSAKTGQLDLESMGPLFSPPVPMLALPGVFLAFDENRDGHIDFKELCCGVSAACRGPTVERSKFCFKIFDTDRDGLLNFSEIKQMIEILLIVARESSNSKNYRNVTVDGILAELHRKKDKKLFVVEDGVDGTTERSSRSEEEDNNDETTIVNDGGTTVSSFNLTQEDFLMWNVESASNIVQPFLDLLFEMCHIVLGLRPQCRHLEHDIVKGWMSREVRRGYKIGQFWYLISSDWWQNWLQYTQNTSSSQCSYCKSTPTYLMSSRVDEAMICDESFTSNSIESMGDLLAGGGSSGGGGGGDSSSLGSGSSGISYGRNSSSRPGPIDNTSLIAPNLTKSIQTLTGEGGRLKRDTTLVIHRDFELVPDSLWKALSQWYRGLLPLPRQVIQPPNSPEVELELYPLNLRILRHQNPAPVTQTAATTWGAVSGGYGALASAGSYSAISTVPQALQPPKRYLAYTAAFSRLATLKQVAEFLCQRLKLKVEDVRLWHIISASNSMSSSSIVTTTISSSSNQSNDVSILLEEEQMTLQEIMINDNDQILLEIRSKDLTWPEELGSLTLNNHHNQSSSVALLSAERRPTIASIHAPGATGLHNLGNTCFMNAALQVLFNTQPLAQYFCKNMHMYELNVMNKLGTKGQLALKYSELLKEIWTASTRSVAPLKLRFCVTKHAPQFAGGGQHDSQELLEWFLDALHEDLNRVMEKPYSELKDSDGRADSVVAAEAWAQHHSRNQSIIIDLFYGQLKSKVSCLACGRDSVRFDPFSLLSLPLPVENFVYCEVLVILLDGSVPIKYGLRLNSESKYIDLKNELAKLCGLNSNVMLTCELSGSQIKSIITDDQKVKVSGTSELYIYEVPLGYERPRTSSELGVNIEQGLKDIQRNPALLLSPDSHQLTTTSSISTGSSDAGDQPNTPLNNGATSSDGNVNVMSMTSTDSTINRRTSKHSEISTSPVASPFVHGNSTIQSSSSGNNKTVSTINLLSPDGESASSSLDENTNTMMMNDRDVSSAINNKSVDDKLESPSRTSGYLIAVHRKMSRQDTYFLSHHKSRPSLFGVPLLIPYYQGDTNKNLYCAVWIQVARLLSPLPPTPPDQANHATDCDDSLGYEFPFILRAVSENGRVCAICPWSRFCRGCEIPCNEMPLLKGIIRSENPSISSSPNFSSRERISSTATISALDTNLLPPNDEINLSLCGGLNNGGSINIAIDWDPTALHLRYQSTRERVWTEHSSVEICRKQQTEPVDLDHCLRAFTSEEKLEQWYHCSHCKSKKPATKKLQIWKLPPILIIHLKRFNCVNNKWVKSQKVVNFPYTDFDPTPYLASVPQETILRHSELKDHMIGTTTTTDHNILNYDCEEEITEFDREDYDEMTTTTTVHTNYRNNNDEILTNGDLRGHELDECHTCQLKDDITQSIGDGINGYCSVEDIDEDNESDGVVVGGRINKTIGAAKIKRPPTARTLERRKRLVSTSLVKTPVIDGEFIDFHKHELKPGNDAFDLKYKLYAVVSHSGMLNGGHYISYATNPNGSWYCYNDSSCREIPSRPNIDPGCAYLLFYERQGLNYEPYLPNVDNRTIPNGNLIEADDSDSDIRKLCVLA